MRKSYAKNKLEASKTEGLSMCYKYASKLIEELNKSSERRLLQLLKTNLKAFTMKLLTITVPATNSFF